MEAALVCLKSFNDIGETKSSGSWFPGRSSLASFWWSNFCRVFTQRAAAIVAEKSSVPLFTAQPTGKCDLATFNIFFSAFRLCFLFSNFQKSGLGRSPRPGPVIKQMKTQTQFRWLPLTLSFIRSNLQKRLSFNLSAVSFIPFVPGSLRIKLGILGLALNLNNPIVISRI